MASHTVAQYLAEQLDAWGIQTVYGVPGDAILPFLDAISKHPRLKFISVKHEATAALMASAEAKLMDRIGVCVATSGPGSANLINGLADAKSDRAPVLAITGQVDSFNIGTDYKQYIDQSLLMSAVAGYSGLVSVPDSCNDVIIKALRTALGEGTVAHVAFTQDVWQLPTVEKIRPMEPYIKTAAQSPPEVIAEAVKRLNEARRPAILAGRGIRNLGTQMIEFASKWQAGICLTMAAKGRLPIHPLVMGGVGQGGSEASTAMLSEADMIAIIGATWWPDKYVPDETRIIQLDVVPGNIGGQIPVEYGVVGDLSRLLPAITEGLSRTEKPEWLSRLHSFSQRWSERTALETGLDRDTISPGFLMKTLEGTIAGNAIITLDVGDHTVWFNRIFNGTGQEILVSGSWRTMGFGVPAALSAKLAQPERQVVAITGDGGFAMCLGDFLTAVRYQLPIIVVVVNNGFLAMERDKMEMMAMNVSVTAISNPDFAKFAQACGGTGFRVERPGNLKNILHQAIQSQQPAVVDVITSPDFFPGMEQKSHSTRELAIV